MLITPYDLARYWGLSPEVIVHVGAHEAEEFESYRSLGWGRSCTVWVEALPRQANVVRRRVASDPRARVVEAVAWDVTGDIVDFNETNNGQSSSALALGLHATTYPDIRVTDVVKRETSRLEDVIDLEALGPIGLVNLDIQGAELRALKGFGAHVGQAQAVYSEVNRVELYEDCDLFPQLNAWLEARGFSCVDWELLPEGWGDALWLRRDCIPAYPRSRRRARLALKGIHRATTTARQLPARARASAKRRLGLF